MKPVSYWLDSAPAFAGAETGAVEGEVDVAVVGGGFTGLSAALALAQAGASVMVLERGRVVGAQSGRNGGHVNNGLAHDFGAVAQRLGMEQARGLYRAFDAAVDTVERIVMEQQIACDFRRGGKIKLAASAAHFEGMARGFDVLQREADAETELLERGRVREEIGSDIFHGALVYRRSAQMHMGKFGAGLAVAAARHGARIFENAGVTQWRRQGGAAYRLTTARGIVLARRVFVATGAAVNGPWFFRRRIIPIGSFIIATAPLSEAQVNSIMPTRRTATTTRHIGNYFRIAPDNRLIFGGRARFALSNPASDVKSGLVLQGQLREMFPQIAAVPIDYCWGGEVDATADRLPRAGERDGMVYAMGLSGHGTQMSVHLGQCMARVMGGEAAANPLAELAWPAVAGHFGPPWFLPAVGLYYRIKDRLGA